MFQGATLLSLDAKGRMAIPARHRDALASAGAGHLVLTAHPDRCLLLYPAPAWAPIRAKILAAPSLDARAARARRLLVGFAVDLEVDAAHRVLVPPELRQCAHLDKDVWLVGQGNYFEVWSDAGWRAQQEQMFAIGDDLPPGLDDLVL